MNLNDLLRAENIDIDPQEVLVLRHTPKEPRLKKALPHLAAEKPNVFNAYQQTQGAELDVPFCVSPLSSGGLVPGLTQGFSMPLI